MTEQEESIKTYLKICYVDGTIISVDINKKEYKNETEINKCFTKFIKALNLGDGFEDLSKFFKCKKIYISWRNILTIYLEDSNQKAPLLLFKEKEIKEKVIPQKPFPKPKNLNKEKK